MNNYFFVDGSSLLGDVARAKRDLALPVESKLDLLAFAGFFSGRNFEIFHSNSFRRFVFYFVENDERLKSLLILPDFTQAGIIVDLRIEYCGKRIKLFETAKEWLDSHDAPDNVRECLYKSEKAVDTQICCDALQLAATGKLDRLFLYTNDFDFVPLCRALRQLGANINLFRLRAGSMNKMLASECDALHDMPEAQVRAVFKVQADQITPVV